MPPAQRRSAALSALVASSEGLLGVRRPVAGRGELLHHERMSVPAGTMEP
ncbi:hypothetical protein [Aeromicrobium sp. A1-2]|nr:hypothetical protein [Aeromicrobium sp. A1-2]